jgi:hypothetical protein
MAAERAAAEAVAAEAAAAGAATGAAEAAAAGTVAMAAAEAAAAEAEAEVEAVAVDMAAVDAAAAEAAAVEVAAAKATPAEIAAAKAAAKLTGVGSTEWKAESDAKAKEEALPLPSSIHHSTPLHPYTIVYPTPVVRRPLLPFAVGELTCEGWVTKKGSGFPYFWQPRYFVFIGKTHTLYYFATTRSGLANSLDVDNRTGPKPEVTLNGKLILNKVFANSSEPLGLIFEGVFSGYLKRIIVRAPTEDVRAEWLALLPASTGGHLNGLL